MEIMVPGNEQRGTLMQQKIIEYLRPASEGLRVADVRVGLGYTSVRLDCGSIGLAWTAPSHTGHCTHMPRAGTLAGSSAADLLGMLATQNGLSRSIGLATANALVATLPPPETTKQDILDIISIEPSDHVVMVGFFGPLVPVIRRTGCKFDILELEADKPGTMSPEEGKASLAACTVAILTSTSVVTGTLDGLLAGLGKPRAAVMLGPSSLMCPQIFTGTPVTHIAGSRIRDAATVEKIVSEGGGTMILKDYMDFETICL